MRFLDDGRIELDTGLSERSLRGPVLGRKNFLFFGSFPGGRTAAVLYSVVEIAKLHHLNVTACRPHLRTTGGDHAARRVPLDIDSFPILVHGRQPGAAYNGHYRETVYHPLVASYSVAGKYDGMYEGHRLGSGFVHALLRQPLETSRPLSSATWSAGPTLAAAAAAGLPARGATLLTSRAYREPLLERNADDRGEGGGAPRFINPTSSERLSRSLRMIVGKDE